MLAVLTEAYGLDLSVELPASASRRSVWTVILLLRASGAPAGSTRATPCRWRGCLLPLHLRWPRHCGSGLRNALLPFMGILPGGAGLSLAFRLTSRICLLLDARRAGLRFAPLLLLVRDALLRRPLLSFTRDFLLGCSLRAPALALELSCTLLPLPGLCVCLRRRDLAGARGLSRVSGLAGVAWRLRCRNCNPSRPLRSAVDR